MTAKPLAGIDDWTGWATASGRSFQDALAGRSQAGLDLTECPPDDPAAEFLTTGRSEE